MRAFPPRPLPRRVSVVGTSGAGKSTLAARLAADLGVPHVELDALYWMPGWVPRPAEELRAALELALAGDGWVVDGNYGGLARERVWALADTVVWLDLDRATVMRRVTARTLRRSWRGEVLWNGNRERLWTTLASRDSILWWAWSTHARRRAEYAALAPGLGDRLVRLRTPEAVDAWIVGVRHQRLTPVG